MQSHDCLTVSTLFVSNTTQPGVLHDDILMILIHTGRALLTQFYTKTTANTHTHARLTALFPGLPRWAGTRKVKPIWILLKQEPENGSGISWAICKSASYSRQTTTPAPHLSVFYRPDALPAAQPTVSKHWRQNYCKHLPPNYIYGTVWQYVRLHDNNKQTMMHPTS